VSGLLQLLAALLAVVGVDAPGTAQPAGEAVPRRPPAVVQPRPYEAWDGTVSGVAPAGAGRVVVRAGRRTWRLAVAADGSYRATVRPVPRGVGSVVVAGHRVEPVWGVPAGSLRALAPAVDVRALDRRLARLAAAATPIVGAYVHTAAGPAGAYNAGASFDAASTLKLPLMLAALARLREPLEDSELWPSFQAITAYSDNAAANTVLRWLGGSEEGGAAVMTRFARALGARATGMLGGYPTDVAGGGPPREDVVAAPPDPGKHTTPADMARLAAAIVDGAAGAGPLVRRGVTAHESRQLLYLMLGAQDPGLVSPAAAGLPVAHKIGWLDAARHDVAIVFGRRGAHVVSVFALGPIDGTVAAFGAGVTRAALNAPLR
jgi:beta-lactamase class A